MPTPTLTPHAFVSKWRGVSVKEKSGYQEHFRDLCALVGHPTPLEADPTGTHYAYEAGATKQGGKQGWADVWKQGHFAIEYKGKHANLDTAYQQLLQYRESLQNPPLLIVSDMDRLIIHTNFTNTQKRIIELPLDDLLTDKGYRQLEQVFYDPFAFKSEKTTEQVTTEAAEEFAKIAHLLQRYSKRTPHDIAHFLIRLLFCLFAEDVGLLPRGLFSRLVEQTQRKAAAFSNQLSQLFKAMATGGWFGSDEIRHFNGKLFDDDLVIDLDSDSLDILLKASRMDWSSIEPSVL